MIIPGMIVLPVQSMIFAFIGTFVFVELPIAVMILFMMTNVWSKINISDVEFNNLGDKIIDRNLDSEMKRLVELLIRFGDKKYNDWKAEVNPYRKASLPKDILSYYEKADLLNKHIDPKEMRARIKELKGSIGY
jgi:hypothetical protein